MTDWRHRAACRDEDPEPFFPHSPSSAAGQIQIQNAKAVCGRCSVTSACLAWALATNQQHGVLGGKSEDERRSLRRRASRSKVA